MTDALGILAEPIAIIRQMLADSVPFQQWVGAANAVEALAFVHLVTAPASAGNSTHALIDYGDFSRERQRVQGNRIFNQRKPTSFMIYFEGLVDPDNAEEPDALLEYINVLGAVWQDLEERAGQYNPRTGFITSIDLSAPPERILPEKSGFVGDFYESVIQVEVSL